MTPTASHLRACLPDLAARTEAQLLTLYNDPTPDRCELMVRCLHEVQTACQRLASELHKEPIDVSTVLTRAANDYDRSIAK